jgi:hypothetical protein
LCPVSADTCPTQAAQNAQIQRVHGTSIPPCSSYVSSCLASPYRPRSRPCTALHIYSGRHQDVCIGADTAMNLPRSHSKLAGPVLVLLGQPVRKREFLLRTSTASDSLGSNKISIPCFHTPVPVNGTSTYPGRLGGGRTCTRTHPERTTVPARTLYLDYTYIPRSRARCLVSYPSSSTSGLISSFCFRYDTAQFRVLDCAIFPCPTTPDKIKDICEHSYASEWVPPLLRRESQMTSREEVI